MSKVAQNVLFVSNDVCILMVDDMAFSRQSLLTIYTESCMRNFKCIK